MKKTNLYVILLPQMNDKRELGYMIKIGYSKSFEESRNKYGYGQYHRTVEVLHLYEGNFTLEDESKIKQYFKDHVLFGREYLEYCPEVLDFFNTYNTTEKLKKILSKLTVKSSKRYSVNSWIVDYIIQECYKDLDVAERIHKRDKIIEEFKCYSPEKQILNACSIYELNENNLKDYIITKTNLGSVDNKVSSLVIEFTKIKNTEVRLKFIVNLGDEDLTKDELGMFFSLIPDKYKDYYDLLGFEGIRAHKYKEAEIKREVDKLCGNSQKEDKVKEEIYRLFQVGNRYVKADIKSTLKNLYERLGYQKTAKASDLEQYFCLKKIYTSDKKNGFEITGKKE